MTPETNKCDRWVMRQKIVVTAPSFTHWASICKVRHGMTRDEFMLATFRHTYTNYDELSRRLRSRFAGKVERWKLSDAHKLLKRRVNQMGGYYLRRLKKAGVSA